MPGTPEDAMEWGVRRFNSGNTEKPRVCGEGGVGARKQGRKGMQALSSRMLCG